MPVFTFSGKNAAGEKVTGERTSVNKDTLAQQLRRGRQLSQKQQAIVDRIRARGGVD